MWLPAWSASRTVAAGFALVLFGLGVPLTSDSFSRLYAERFLGPKGIADLADAAGPLSTAAALKATDRRFGDPAARLEAGMIERRVAYVSDGRIDAHLLKTADADLRDGLARAPANDLAWAELAQAGLGLGDAQAALGAWRMSIVTGGFDPQLDWWRADMGVQLYLVLNAEDRRLLDRQIVYAWSDAPNKIVSLAEHDAFMASVIRNALARDPVPLKTFENALNSLSK